MKTKNLIELLLFLTEVKSKNELHEKYDWKLDRQINILKGLIDQLENEVQNSKKDKNAKLQIAGVIEWIIKFFTST